MRALLDFGHVTQDPSLAQIFLIPQYATHEMHYCMAMGKAMTVCAPELAESYILPIARVVQASARVGCGGGWGETTWLVGTRAARTHARTHAGHGA